MSRTENVTAIEKACAAWDNGVPDWIVALATECDQTSQAKAAVKIGFSGAVVSNVLRNCYTGDMTNVEERVRGALMSETRTCPALGEIGTEECRTWRGRAKSFSNINMVYVRMFRACKRCPVNTKDASASETTKSSKGAFNGQ